jgi:Nif11 domain
MKTQSNAARFFSALEREQDLQLRQQALSDPQRFAELAQQHGYCLSLHQIAEEVDNLSSDVIAAIWNPGIGPRRHLIRR